MCVRALRAGQRRRCCAPTRRPASAWCSSACPRSARPARPRCVAAPGEHSAAALTAPAAGNRVGRAVAHQRVYRHPVVHGAVCPPSPARRARSCQVAECAVRCALQLHVRAAGHGTLLRKQVRAPRMGRVRLHQPRLRALTTPGGQGSSGGRARPQRARDAAVPGADQYRHGPADRWWGAAIAGTAAHGRTDSARRTRRRQCGVRPGDDQAGAGTALHATRAPDGASLTARPRRCCSQRTLRTPWSTWRARNAPALCAARRAARKPSARAC
jgi:hypothetical protein